MEQQLAEQQHHTHIEMEQDHPPPHHQHQQQQQQQKKRPHDEMEEEEEEEEEEVKSHVKSAPSSLDHHEGHVDHSVSKNPLNDPGAAGDKEPGAGAGAGDHDNDEEEEEDDDSMSPPAILASLHHQHSTTAAAALDLKTPLLLQTSPPVSAAASVARPFTGDDAAAPAVERVSADDRTYSQGTFWSFCPMKLSLQDDMRGGCHGDGIVGGAAGVLVFGLWFLTYGPLFVLSLLS